MLEREFRLLMEKEELDTVSDAFGGPKAPGSTKSYSVTKLRDWLLTRRPYEGQDELSSALSRAEQALAPKLFKLTIINLIRYSFLIELTNLTVGSTKMKTRWVPGLILMPQQDSYEPIKGSFEPGNDPRASSFEECLAIFIKCLNVTCDNALAHSQHLESLSSETSFPYEFTFDYISPAIEPVHVHENIAWSYNEDIAWLIAARPIVKKALTKQQLNKIRTKTYKTDRALTGKDKTNRAKRWEILSGDFQHSSLKQCWSVERKLLSELVGFKNFPASVIAELQHNGLLDGDLKSTRCPVTLEELDYAVLMQEATHGVSDYQVGHLHPLKRGGRHEGINICWQSSDGNRIQGDMMIEDITNLLRLIESRRAELEL